MTHDLSHLYPGQGCVMMTITVTSTDGRPAHLVPYLGAASHISITDSKNDHVIHGHGMGMGSGSHDMEMICDMHYGDMPEETGRSVSYVLMAGFLPKVRGVHQAVVQMKSPANSKFLITISKNDYFFPRIFTN